MMKSLPGRSSVMQRTNPLKHLAQIDCRLHPDLIEIPDQPIIGCAAANLKQMGEECPFGIHFAGRPQRDQLMLCFDDMNIELLVVLGIQLSLLNEPPYKI
jgi:hypothetical protein